MVVKQFLLKMMMMIMMIDVVAAGDMA